MDKDSFVEIVWKGNKAEESRPSCCRDGNPVTQTPPLRSLQILRDEHHDREEGAHTTSDKLRGVG